MKSIRDLARTLARECDADTLRVMGDAIHNHIGGTVTTHENMIVARRIEEAVAIAERLKAEADASVCPDGDKCTDRTGCKATGECLTGDKLPHDWGRVANFRMVQDIRQKAVWPELGEVRDYEPSVGEMIKDEQI